MISHRIAPGIYRVEHEGRLFEIDYGCIDSPEWGLYEIRKTTDGKEDPIWWNYFPTKKAAMEAIATPYYGFADII